MTLSLSQAEQIAGRGRLSLGAALAMSAISSAAPPQVPVAAVGSPSRVETSRDAGAARRSPERDADDALTITQRQAAGPLPNGRFRVADTAGRIVATVEHGESYCAEGRRLVQQRRGVDAARARMAHEHAVQESWFSESRC